MISHLYHALVLISSVNYGISVPPEYCLHPLNKDDCNWKPTRVFTYYRPGSRCEIEIWRGCATLNMFYDELTCSDMCIGEMYQPPRQGIEGMDDTDDGVHSKFPMFSEFYEGLDGPCYERFNGDDCGEKVEMKYFFSGDLCVRTEWRGCDSPNIFDDLQTCIKVCHPLTYFEPTVKETIAELPVEEINEIDKLIEDAFEQEAIVTELPVLSEKQKRLPQKKINNLLLKIYNLKNITSFEVQESEEKNEVVYDYDEKNDVEDDEIEYDEELIEHEMEDKEEPKPEPLAIEEESVEGSLEEVFTLS